MRITPLVGRKLWFGPRGWGGWGWSPVSWEGWAVIGVVLVLAIAGESRVNHGVLAAVILVVVIGACVLKGTPPGGPSRQREYRAELSRSRTKSGG